MERKLARATLISPAPSGWKVSSPSGATTATAATLAEAARAIPAGQPLHLALPSDFVIMERMTLPSIDSAELGDMMRLQFEKSLPFAPEDVTSDYELLQARESDSTVLALALPNAQLETLCAPLRDAQRLPEQVTMYALHVAASCPPEGVFLAIYREEGKYVAAVVENTRLAFLNAIPAADLSDVPAELTQVLFAAELDGVPTNFSGCQLDENARELAEPLRTLFGVAVVMISLDRPLPEPKANLLPQAWKHEASRRANREKTKGRLMAAGVIYLLLVALAFGYLIFLRKRLNDLDQQIRTMQPQMEFIQQQKGRWDALAPAVDPSRYPVEILSQLEQTRVGEDLRFTSYEQKADQWTLRLEAPSASAAVDFGTALQKNPALEKFRIELGEPNILPNEHAQMTIYGKL